MNEVDQRSFVIRLEAANLNWRGAGCSMSLNQCLDFSQRYGAIPIGLPRTEQIQVWAIDHQYARDIRVP
jgi:hypothetical protein